jgi:hypothetical protein
MFTSEVGFYKAVMFLIIAIFVVGMAIGFMNGDFLFDKSAAKGIAGLFGG